VKEGFVENINSLVAGNLKRLREQKKMSLDDVARVSGVSKSMLGQIERGDVNPTISTVWKIASGLKVTFTELVSQPEMECEVIDIVSIQPLLEDSGHFRNYPIFPFGGDRRFEILYLELDPGSRHDAEAHHDGTQEFITVFSGELTVYVNGAARVVRAGSSIRFLADRPHGYQNTGSELCRLSNLLYYPK
jgi:XRE family transcriptional regulator, regulator of sulfur utilization